MKNFLKLASICSILGAVTTTLLIFLPGVDATGIEETVALHQNSLYMSKLWILFFHPQFNMFAALAISALFIKKHPGLVIPGTFFILLWAVTEVVQQAYMIDAVNQIWRPQYSGELDQAAKEAIEIQLMGSKAVWDTMYFLVIYGFGLGSLLLGLVFIREDTLARCIGAGFVFIGILSILSFLRYYAGFSVFSAPVDWVYGWVYPGLQPLVRIALGFWLWKQASYQKAQN